jgi:hypothetical protein
MLDRSSSINETTGAGPTKWDAIRQALTSFVRDPLSNGFGVGLQYFPLAVAGVPEHCTTDRDCGAQGGQCLSKACLPPATGQATFAFTTCLSTADCPPSSQGCAPFGVCSGDDKLACFDLGTGGCQSKGDCVAFQGQCTDYTSCTISDYATPAVPIGVLPGNADRLVNALTAQHPAGLTPTPVALAGALKLAAQQAVAHPDRRVITVLATDGLPTECLSADVQTAAQAVASTAKVAASGFMATPRIMTYVIGVFGPMETTAKTNLNSLAAAGGTKTAFIVDQSQDVTKQLLDAFTKIRTGVLQCEYQLPNAPTEQSLDFTRVNVQLTTMSQPARTLAYVRSATLCSKSKLGWYYDADPALGGTPTKISVCPATCDSLQAEQGASVEIQLGCATLGPG